MLADDHQFEKLTGRKVRKPESDADRVVTAIAGLADALTKQAEKPAAQPVVEITVPPSSVTVQDIPPEPRRPWRFDVERDSDGRLKSITATPIT